MLELRAEMEREGFVFTTEEQEFTLDEDITITQGRSSVANQGSGALHTYIKDTRREELRRKKQQEEWEKMVYRLEQLKKERKANEELAKQSKNRAKNQKQKARKRQKKNNKDAGSDSDSDDGELDFTQIFAEETAPTTTAETPAGSSSTDQLSTEVAPTTAPLRAGELAPTQDDLGGKQCDAPDVADPQEITADSSSALSKKRAAVVDIETLAAGGDDQHAEQIDENQDEKKN